jgi:pimeloyl-ACP methyl ester carboxylesterase
VLIADRRVASTRRAAIAGQDAFADEPADRYGYVTADDGIALAYQEDGPADAPLTVLALHGFCLDRHDFLFQRRALLERYGERIRLITYDHRSHGASERAPAASATIDQLGADLAAVLSELAPSGPIVLIGHSMGGMTILALADRQPDLFAARVRGVVLISTSAGRMAGVTLGLPAALARVQTPLLGRLLRGARLGGGLVERGRARLGDVAWVFVKRLAFAGPVEPALVEYLSRLIATTPVEVIADFYPTLMDHDKLAALDVLAGTRVAVICGADDLVTPAEHSRAIAAALPDSELLIVPDAGHQALMQRPDLVDPAIFAVVDAALADRRTRSGRRA